MYALIEQYQPKEGKQSEVIEFVTAVAKDYTFKHEDVLLSQILKPSKESGYVSSYTLWKSEEAFKSFIKSDAFQELLKSGVINKAQEICSDIKADTYDLLESHHL